MTRKEQHKARKRKGKDSCYRELFFGTIYINPLNRFVFKWQLIEVEDD